MDRAISKIDLRRQMERFFDDKDRGISIKNFADIAGYTEDYLRKIFVQRTEELSSTAQIRISRALVSWRRGEIRVMETPITRKRYAEYRPKGEAKTRINRKVSFEIKDGAIRLQPGPVNRMDYSQAGLDELLGD